jgi:hypothetical protein
LVCFDNTLPSFASAALASTALTSIPDVNRFKLGVAAENLRRLTERPQKGAAI